MHMGTERVECSAGPSFLFKDRARRRRQVGNTVLVMICSSHSSTWREVIVGPPQDDTKNVLSPGSLPVLREEPARFSAMCDPNAGMAPHHGSRLPLVRHVSAG
jgi:hypothetical protein